MVVFYIRNQTQYQFYGSKQNCTYVPCISYTEKKLFQYISLAICFTCEYLIHTIEYYRSDQVGMEPVSILGDDYGLNACLVNYIESHFF